MLVSFAQQSFIIMLIGAIIGAIAGVVIGYFVGKKKAVQTGASQLVRNPSTDGRSSNNLFRGGKEMRFTRSSIALMLFLASALVGSGCATSLKTKMLAPARAHEAAQLKRIAVLPFEGPQGAPTSKDVEAMMVSVQVDGKPFFHVIERSALEKVVREQKLQMSSLVDESTAASVGRFLGAEAVISGAVSQNTTDDKRYSEKRSKCVSEDKKGKCKRWGEYTVGCTERIANFSFTPKIIKVDTARISASEVMSGKATDKACSDAQKPLRSGNELLEVARKDAMEQYRSFIAPHYIDLEITLITKDESKMGEKVEKKIEDGVEWANAGRLDRACECWHEASTFHNKGYAVPYLLGVCCETRGELVKAQEYYMTADRQTQNPVKEISAALARVRENIEKQRKVREQVGK